MDDKKKLLVDDKKKYENLFKRLIFGWAMIFATAFIIWLGHFAISMLVRTTVLIFLVYLLFLVGNKCRNIHKEASLYVINRAKMYSLIVKYHTD